VRIPSEEHFLPLFVALGAAGPDADAERVVEGFEAGALAMDSYLFRSQSPAAPYFRRARIASISSMIAFIRATSDW
jgi:hypothetical protein